MNHYVLGSDDAEIARLDLQASTLAAPTAMLLRAAGIREGMRVLDLGTGLGHVAFAVADVVGPGGAVVGLDQSERLLAVAEQRRSERGSAHVRFAHGDARTFRDPEPFDAVVARLLLFHLPDAAAVVRHHREALAPGGVMLALDFDLGGLRSEPQVASVADGNRWVEAAFRRAGADPRVGARLLGLLRRAGLADAMALGITPYLAPDDPRGPAQLAGVVRTLSRQQGVTDIDPDELRARATAELRDADAALLLPTLVGAWGRR